mmetsp:Transcript_4402/g.5432  ORF Transcript_4402/g.5432 Transcript_4402/m.5432 type:complete len:610 (-) Transcript_4402:861-2690(-)|eukprot:CAMPEP_0184008722 /NCGR_PEP_ID=MMETSP0954-20121128/2150_1 /TAXON_ID=627963 /ORGANISM="Aplanochytrium sp, Strain PBS07" /LENGTH=609 /DNA_ID=CAMNT_0026287901 /DNA_START=59 /DNA_END=1888 /DNA_ORIENTATION=+
MSAQATAENSAEVVPPEIADLLAKEKVAVEKVVSLKAEKADAGLIKEAVDEMLKIRSLLPPQYQPKKKEKEKKKKGGGADERAAKKEARRLARLKKQGGGDENKVVKDISADMYGDLPLPQSRTNDKSGRIWFHVKNLTTQFADERQGEKVWVRGYAHTVRGQSKFAFIVLRQTLYTVQCVVNDKAAAKWAGKIPSESVIDIEGTVVKLDKPTKATQQDVEIQISKIFVVSRSTTQLPFQVVDAGRSEEEIKALEEKDEKVVRVGLDNRLDNRHLDLRTPVSQAICRINSYVCKYFRDYLLDEDFVEIQTPKLLGGASEGGADVFMLDYFGRPCCLAQSPQIHKQITSACSGLERVFEIGPVFRAENSNTNRHLCEFHGLDIEMAFKEHYHEVLDTFSDMFTYIFDNLYKNQTDELATVRKYHHFEDLVYRAPDSVPKEKISGTFGRTLRLTFEEAIKMLREAGVTEEEQEDYDDLSTPVEKKLGGLVKEKYGVDFYFLDKFPLEPRPFYTMPCPENPKLSNSYDFFIRGQEILSGAQRVHDSKMLEKAVAAKGVPVESLRFYIDSFKVGAQPHGGGGIGLERVVMLFLGLPNIRNVTYFTRDPGRLAP